MRGIDTTWQTMNVFKEHLANSRSWKFEIFIKNDLTTPSL